MSVAAKARELLRDIDYEERRCPHCGGELSGERWVRLSNFDPPHGRSEISYAVNKGLLRLNNDGCVSVTSEGRKYLARKPRSDSVAAKGVSHD